MSQATTQRYGPVGSAIRNAAWLLGGKGVGGLFSLVYLALSARALGVHEFGVFAMVLSYGQAILNLVQFQSWQTVIRYGTLHLHHERPNELRRLLAFTFGLDLGSSAVGALLAVGGALLLGSNFGWTLEQSHIAALFGLSLLLSVRNTPNGMLRLLDRFDLGAYAETILPAMRLIGSVAAWCFMPTIGGFLLAWAVAEMVTSIATWWVAVNEYRQKVKAPVERQNLLRGVVGENFGLWKFAWNTNFATSVGLVWQQLPVLAVGWFFGPGSAGGYRIAAQITAALSKPATALSRAVYPEFARLAHGDTSMLVKVMKRSTSIATITGILSIALVILAGHEALNLIGGPGYAFAYPILVLLTVAAAIDFCGFGLEPALIATGRPGLVLVIRAVSGLVYISLLVYLMYALGPLGAAVATIFSSLMILFLLMFYSIRTIERSTEIGR